MTSIDLSRTTGLIELGTHTFKVMTKSEETMPDSGTPGWRLICQVISPGENQGKELLHFISLGVASRFKMDEFLDGIGAPKRGKWTLEQCFEKKFRASVGEDTYQGKLKSTLESILPASESKDAFDQPSEVSVEDDALPDDVLPDDDEGDEEEAKPSGRRKTF